MDQNRRDLLSVEAAVTLVLGLMVGLIPDMEWWLRALGVLGTAVLAIHTAKRMDKLTLKLLFPSATISILILGTWHSIWIGFRNDFPAVTGEYALSKIIEFLAVATAGIAGYFFLLRPRAKEGYRVLPAQVMAFGICLVGIGFLTALAGIGWQFQQNWAAGVKPSGAPAFTVGPPLIAQGAPAAALPPPAPNPELTPYFANYALTEVGISALAAELYKSRDALGRRIELDRMSTDPSSGPFASGFARACDQAGVDCPDGNLHPNSPEEKGLLIYVGDPNKPPTAAEELRKVLLKLGLDVPFVVRPGFGPHNFSLFIGPRPS